MKTDTLFLLVRLSSQGSHASADLVRDALTDGLLRYNIIGKLEMTEKAWKQSTMPEPVETRVVDYSGGDAHIRQCAEESGMDYLGYLSHEETATVDGFTVETWYDEDASSGFTAWGAFIGGVGSCSGPSREDAIAAIITKAKK